MLVFINYWIEKCTVKHWNTYKVFDVWVVTWFCRKWDMLSHIWRGVSKLWRNMCNIRCELAEQKTIGPVILVTHIAHHTPTSSGTGTSWSNMEKLLFRKFKHPLGWSQVPPRGIILRRARYKGPSSQQPALLHDLPRRVWKSRRYRDEQAGVWMHFLLTTLTFPFALSDNALEGPRVSYLSIISESTESDKRCRHIKRYCIL